MTASFSGKTNSGEGRQRGSQVARVQAVVCSVISAQVFKQPDMHKETGGEAVTGVEVSVRRELR